MDSNVKNILLVDDNQLFLKMLSRAFKNAGFECLVAASGSEALTILTSVIPDAILSDYEMPGMNGMEFRQHLMADVVLKDIPFIFLTNFSDNELVVKGLDMEAIDYIIKDTPVNIIVSKLNNLLRNVKTQLELSKYELKKAAEALNVKAIPNNLPNVKGFEIDFWHRSFQGIPGGDFIDFIKVNDRYNFVVLGDIMGKKWMAWFFTFSFLSYIRAAIRFGILSKDYSVSGILQKVNEVICLDDILRDILSSLSLIMIDSETKQISYSGAGDLPLLHYEYKTGQLKPVSSEGLLLGLFPDGKYTERYINLAENDQLFIFTDGMIDFLASAGKKSDYNYFADRLKSLLNKKYSFAAIREKLFEPLTDTQIDDCSIISIYKNH